MAEIPKFFREVAEPLKKGSLILGTLALLVGQVGIVAISAIGYFTGRQLEGGKK